VKVSTLPTPGTALETLLRSSIASVLNAGVPAVPDGAAKTVFDACEDSVAVRVPAVVIGEPETEKIDGSVSATEVTPTPNDCQVLLLKNSSVEFVELIRIVPNPAEAGR
jgi:hypothetical protein